MEVRCDKCQTAYEFDEKKLGPDGTSVKCTECGYLFRLARRGVADTLGRKTSIGRPSDFVGSGTPTHPDPVNVIDTGAIDRIDPIDQNAGTDPDLWMLRLTTGEVFTFRDLTTLHQWIVEGKVTRQDELSRKGDRWRELGDINEFSSFFNVVDRAQAAVYPLSDPPPSAAPPPREERSFASRERSALPSERSLAKQRFELDASVDERDPRAPAVSTRSNAGMWLVLASILLVGSITVYMLQRATGNRATGVTVSALPHVAPTPATVVSDLAQAATDLAPSPIAVVTPIAPARTEPDAAVATAPIAVAAPANAPTTNVSSGEPKNLLAEATRLLENGKTKAARQKFEKALASDPRSTAALTGLAYCDLDSERYLAAVDGFKRVLEIAPEDGEALIGVAEAYKISGHHAQALDYYRRYLNALPSGPKAAMAEKNLRDMEERVIKSAETSDKPPASDKPPTSDKSPAPEKALALPRLPSIPEDAKEAGPKESPGAKEDPKTP